MTKKDSGNIALDIESQGACLLYATSLVNTNSSSVPSGLRD